MQYVTSFIGTPPDYWILCVQQIRLFTSDPIWCITNHINHRIVQELSSIPNVVCVDYATVKHEEFDKVSESNKHRFHICHGLHGREELFIRSFERFFLCEQLMKQNSLTDVLFLELDNLVYEDMSIYLPQFQKKGLAYMYDNDDRSSSGIMYIKDWTYLSKLNQSSLDYISTTQDFLTEMTVLYRYANAHSEDVQYLPVHIPDENVPIEAYGTFHDYNCIFDAAPLGVYLYGRDPYHTDGTIIKQLKNPWSKIDFTNYMYEIVVDTRNHKTHWIVFPNGQRCKIVNLHIHSKNLVDAFSIVTKG